ncbi:MAG: DUF177 domain-containing protein [Dehalococcoidia bacterium]|nr:DUF177 domain-containing protein [Dehalococcoidia bacterium]
MDINVAQLLKEPIGAERRYHVDEEGANAHYLTEVLRLEGDITLLRSSDSVLVTSRLKALVEMTCVRCLESFRQLIPVEFKEEYFPLLDVSTGLRLPPPNDPTSFTIGPDHVLDLKEALRQHTLLALPMKPVCRQDCLGLCQLCGVDRNQGPCQCPDEPADPRLASLAELKSKLA